MIKDYWIELLQNVKEFKALSDIEDIELDVLRTEIANLIDDQFIETAAESGISRREKMLNIQPYADDTLESRRFRITNQWNTQLPYTYRKLLEKLNSLVGEDGYEINLNTGEYSLNVKINLTQKRMLSDSDKMIKTIAPSNLLITVELKYNRYIDVGLFTYEQLNSKTFIEIREEVLS